MLVAAANGISDDASLASEPVHVKTAAKREEMHQYVSQVLKELHLHIGTHLFFLFMGEEEGNLKKNLFAYQPFFFSSHFGSLFLSIMS